MNANAQIIAAAMGITLGPGAIADVPEIPTFERYMGNVDITGEGESSIDLIVDRMNYHSHMLIFRRADNSLATAGEIRDALKKVWIEVSASTEYKADPSFLQDLQNFHEEAFGGGAIDGVLVIDHVRKSYQERQDGYRNVWGTAGETSMQVKIDVQDNSVVKKWELVSVVDDREGITFGNHISVKPVQISQTLIGDHVITKELPFMDAMGCLALHVRTDKCAHAKLEVNDKTIHPKQELALNNMSLKSFKRTPMTGTYTLDFSKQGLSTSMLLYPKQSQKLTLTMSAATGGVYTIYVESQEFRK